MSLTDLEVRVLAFERSWWKHQGAKDQAVLETFSFSRTRYEQIVNALLERPEALEHDSQLVMRLRRIRDRRRSLRHSK